MNFQLSDHARKRCLRRRIPEAWIAQALSKPMRTEGDADDGRLAHALWPVPEKGFRVLRVIYNHTRDPVTVVTAYFDNEVSPP
ncbi:hypothetical protein CKO31_02825 [Thiohalocapsa halophila]|uniref:DUF4258 domain-containing protein n=1 Tax=Thiohalocapsa halophila TaxID=69359 RepID=A0ABS1CCT3_9GAMM|nr:DUF4258 domain-containing protein [Thiohalocapsa halophila]MBK1629688.1 hypothetical protein [Thiohalocapsa halophila]